MRLRSVCLSPPGGVVAVGHRSCSVRSLGRRGMALIKSAVTPPEWAVPAQSPRRGGLCPRAVGGGGLPGSLLVFRGTGRFSRFP